MKRVNAPDAVYTRRRQARTMNRPKPRPHSQLNATERAIDCVIYRWYVQGLQQQLRRGG